VAESLTGLLVAPLNPIDPVAWSAALDDATHDLAALAAVRRGAGPLQITDHELRLAGRTGERAAAAGGTTFAWTARTARRVLGLAAVRSLVAGRSRTPSEAVRERVAQSTRLVRDSVEPISGMDRWLAGLPPAGRAAAAAEAVTWATRLWCALDWSALGTRPVVGRDRWWDSPHSALLALRSRAEVRAGGSHLVLLSGPRRDSVHAELALVTLVESLRAPAGGPPGRVVGWWPDSGHTVRLEPEPRVLALAVGSVSRALGRSTPGRAA
jgi:hypothetical protein